LQEREKALGTQIGVFIDRDGTLNEERNFIRSPEDLHLISGAAEAIRKLNRRSILTCVISNQSGVARGYLTEEDLARVHTKLVEELARQDARVDKIYYCPHHPTDGIALYKINCNCRKPNPGMLKLGEQELNIDLSRAYIIGDKLVDIQAGKAVGATTILVLTGYGQSSLVMCKKENISPDYTAPSIKEGVEYIIQRIDGYGAKDF